MSYVDVVEYANISRLFNFCYLTIFFLLKTILSYLFLSVKNGTLRLLSALWLLF